MKYTLSIMPIIIVHKKDSVIHYRDVIKRYRQYGSPSLTEYWIWTSGA